MAVLYKAVQSNLANKDGEYLYYPRVVYTGTVSLSQLSDEIAEYSSLSPGDVKNALSNLVTVLTQHLQSSQIVNIEGLGNFRLVMTSKGNGVKSADDVNASQASLYVRFHGTTTKNLNKTIATRAMVTGSKCVRYESITTVVSASDVVDIDSDDSQEATDNQGSNTGNGSGTNVIDPLA